MVSKISENYKSDVIFQKWDNNYIWKDLGKIVRISEVNKNQLLNSYRIPYWMIYKSIYTIYFWDRNHKEKSGLKRDWKRNKDGNKDGDKSENKDKDPDERTIRDRDARENDAKEGMDWHKDNDEHGEREKCTGSSRERDDKE